MMIVKQTLRQSQIQMVNAPRYKVINGQELNSQMSTHVHFTFVNSQARKVNSGQCMTMRDLIN